jgi:hypothetical protein
MGASWCSICFAKLKSFLVGLMHGYGENWSQKLGCVVRKLVYIISDEELNTKFLNHIQVYILVDCSCPKIIFIIILPSVDDIVCPHRSVI